MCRDARSQAEDGAIVATDGAIVGNALQGLRRRIEKACQKAGRDPAEVALVGACKRQPIARLQAAYDAGLRIFGENRVQEASANQPRLPDDISWHLIGPLQSNKARKAAELFDVVESVDRIKIAHALDREATKLERRLACFLEVNLAGESTKHGFAVAEVTSATREMARLSSLDLVGLMAIPPPAETPDGARHWFRELRRLRDDLRSRLDGFPGFLSMGMSDDFEVAIEEGATHVRIGTALFGARNS